MGAIEDMQHWIDFDATKNRVKKVKGQRAFKEVRKLVNELVEENRRLRAERDEHLAQEQGNKRFSRKRSTGMGGKVSKKGRGVQTGSKRGSKRTGKPQWNEP